VPSLRDMLPGLYRPLLPAFFDTEAPAEEKATCGSCAMCPPPGAAADGAYFRPDVKCCTYHPRLPNYLVGALLADDDPALAEGRRRVERVIAGRIGITPRWVAPPRKSRVIYHAARRSSFGRSLLLRCPYYEQEQGLCTIWRWRETDCSTFFCKYTAGAAGQTFWRALNGYLHGVQRRLAEHAARTVAPHLVEPTVEAGELTVEDLEDRPPDAYPEIWGEWAGREAELYRACREVVAALDAGGFAAIAEGDGQLAHLQGCHQAMVAPSLPERLAPNPALTTAPHAAGLVVSTYSDYDPLVVSPALFEVIQRFSAAETVAETRARLADEGVEIPEALLLMLVQMEVLVAPEPG
jgi:hypothetical protein